MVRGLLLTRGKGERAEDRADTNIFPLIYIDWNERKRRGREKEIKKKASAPAATKPSYHTSCCSVNGEEKEALVIECNCLLSTPSA